MKTQPEIEDYYDSLLLANTLSREFARLPRRALKGPSGRSFTYCLRDLSRKHKFRLSAEILALCELSVPGSTETLPR